LVYYSTFYVIAVIKTYLFSFELHGNTYSIIREVLYNVLSLAQGKARIPNDAYQ